MTDELKTLAVEIGAEIARQLRPPQVESIVPLNEAAELLHIQPCTLRRMVYSNKIGFIVDGKSYYFKVSDLNDYLNSHYTPANKANNLTSEVSSSSETQKEPIIKQAVVTDKNGKRNLVTAINGNVKCVTN